MSNISKSRKTVKISSKIIVSIIALNLVLLIIVGGSVGLLVNNNVGEQSREYALSQVAAYSNEFDQEIRKVESAVQMAAAEMESVFDKEAALNNPNYLEELRQEYLPIYENILVKNEKFPSLYFYNNAAYFGQEMNVYYYREADGSLGLYDYFGMEWYTEGDSEWFHTVMKDGAALWTTPYDWDGSILSSYVYPIIIDDIVIGLVGMDIYLDAFAEELGKAELFDSGYFYLMIENGDLLIHPTFGWKEDGTAANLLEQGDYQELLAELNNNESGVTSYMRHDDRGVIAAYTHLYNGWILSTSIPKSEVMAILETIIKIIIIVAVVGISISSVIAYFIGKSISKPILQVVEATNKIKLGDFTTKVQTKSNDETKILAIALNDMTESVQELIGETKIVSIDMLDSASNLAAMSEEATATVAQVADVVNEISSGAQNSATEAENGANVAKVIDESFTILMENSQTMAENAGSVISMNLSGLESLNELKEKSEISKKSNAKIEETINNLDNKVNSITEIISTISSISDQTNLLALNASIEAARAGDAGRGFAVVADEIRKLAEDSSNSAEEISKIVNSIQDESKVTVNAMQELEQISNEQNEAVGNVSESFNMIFEAVEKITSEINDVTVRLKALDATKNELVEVTGNISAVSEETAASTEQVSVSMSDQSKAIDEVSRSADHLNELSVTLNEHIKVFKI